MGESVSVLRGRCAIFGTRLRCRTSRRRLVNSDPLLESPAFLLGPFYSFVISLHFTNYALYPLYVGHEAGGTVTISIALGPITGVLGIGIVFHAAAAVAALALLLVVRNIAAHPSSEEIRTASE